MTSDAQPNPPSAESARQSSAVERSLGLYGATMIGISAMLGAGIFVLSGVALRTAGPGALITFGLSGLLALITAFSFAELASAFPESGGSYVFAKRVFPIGGAFSAGWVLWLAYVVAAALYALGFASFLRMGLEGVGWPLPAWADGGVAVGVLVCGFGLLLRGGASAGSGVTVAKVIAFLILLVPGLVLALSTPPADVLAAVRPVFPNGVGSVFAAMTFTFIALEGFEVIAAVAGEVHEPTRTIPRAMFISIGVTLFLYLALLFVLLVLGAGADGEPAWASLGALGDHAVAVGAERYLGPFGRWVVVVAGLLATFTALSSALLAASRASHSMAADRALPRVLAGLVGKAKTPRAALLTSLLVAVLLVLATGDVEIAGATASLIFLLSFALTNGAGLLVRMRGGVGGASYQAPLYPLLPLLGISGCLTLAALQVQTAPLASLIGGAWLGLGMLLYHFKFRSRAETMSARAEALDSDLVRLRGREPLVLVPIAKPTRAATLTEFGHALAPAAWGRVLALCVAQHREGEDPQAAVAAYQRTTEAMQCAVETASRLNRHFEGAVRVEPDVAKAIARTIAERKPEILLLGMANLDRPENSAFLDRVMANNNLDVAIFSTHSDTFSLGDVRRILVPIAGGSGNDPLRARVLGLLQRSVPREVTLLRVVRSESERARASSQLAELAEDIGAVRHLVEVAKDPVEPLLRRGAEHDLVLIGLSHAQGAPLFGHVVRAVANSRDTSLLMISRTTQASSGRTWRDSERWPTLS